VLSLVASAINEGLSGIFGWRAKYLERGITALVGPALKADFYKHQLIKTLSNPGRTPRQDSLTPSPTESEAAGSVDASGSKQKKTRGPSYISASTFVDTTLDLLKATAPPDPKSDKPAKDELKDLYDRLVEAKKHYPQVGTILGLFATGAKDVDDFKKKVEGWFNEGMERVSGWYKRYTKLALFIIGIFLVLAVNADTVNVANFLWRNPQVRTAVANEATSIAKSEDLTKVKGQEELARIEQLKLPLGWTLHAAATDPQGLPSSASGWLYKILGLVLTATALTFGAPFWFDLLNRFVGLRSSGQQPQPATTGPPSGAPTVPSKLDVSVTNVPAAAAPGSP
jgi:hypothetical protein